MASFWRSWPSLWFWINWYSTWSLAIFIQLLLVVLESFFHKLIHRGLHHICVHYAAHVEQWLIWESICPLVIFIKFINIILCCWINESVFYLNCLSFEIMLQAEYILDLQKQLTLLGNEPNKHSNGGLSEEEPIISMTPLEKVVLFGCRNNYILEY